MTTAKSKPRQAQVKKSDDFRTWAKTALFRRNQSVTALAADLNLARGTVSIAINHPTMLPTVKSRIREALSHEKA